MKAIYSKGALHSEWDWEYFENAFLSIFLMQKMQLEVREHKC
jgi:hypothetical protein